MPRVCKACVHPERNRLEAQALEGVTPTVLSKHFGIAPKGIGRHMRRHVGSTLKSQAEHRNGKSDTSLLSRIQESHAQLRSILEAARDTNELAVAVNAVQGGLRALELEGRLTGELASAGSVTIVAQLGGARVDVARQAVETVRDAQSVPPRTVAERAAAVLRMWNAEQTDRAECIEVLAPRMPTDPS